MATPTQRFNGLVQEILTDRNINGDEMRRLIREAEADGVVSDDERTALRSIRTSFVMGLTVDAQNALDDFLKTYSAESGDQDVTSLSGSLNALKRNYATICKVLGREKDAPLTRKDMQVFIDRTAGSTPLKQVNALAQKIYESWDVLFDKAEKITPVDVEIAGECLDMTPEDAIRVLKAHIPYLDGLGDSKGDGKITNAKRELAASSPLTPRALKAALKKAEGPIWYDVNEPTKKHFTLSSLNYGLNHKALTPERVLRFIDEHWAKIDVKNTRGKGDRGVGADNSIDIVELEDFIARRETPPEARMLAERFLNDYKDKFNTHHGDGKGGRVETDSPWVSREVVRGWLASAAGGLIPVADNTSPKKSSSAPTAITPEDAVTELRAHIAVLDKLDGSGDGAVRKASLEALLTSPDLDPKFKLALEYFIQNFDAFANAAQLSTGNKDELTLADVDAVQGRKGLTVEEVLKILREEITTIAGTGGREFGTRQLEDVVRSKSASLKLKGAASWLLSDKALYERLAKVSTSQGATPGHIGLEALTSSQEATTMNDQVAAEMLLQYLPQVCAGKAHFTRADLELLLRTPDSGDRGPRLKAAATHALQGGLFDQLTRLALAAGRVGEQVHQDDLRSYLRMQPATGLPNASGTRRAGGFAPGLAGTARPPELRRDGAPLGGALSTFVPSGVGGLPGAGGVGSVGASGAAPIAENVDPAQRARQLENERAGEVLDREISSILSDPCLSIEDMVVMVLILIMQEMDRQIEAQLRHLVDLQNQTAKLKEGEKAPSIDIEAAKLKRLTDKRGQIFDIFRQVVDRYNQTAKSIIDTLGR